MLGEIAHSHVFVAYYGTLGTSGGWLRPKYVKSDIQVQTATAAHEHHGQLRIGYLYCRQSEMKAVQLTKTDRSRTCVVVELSARGGWRYQWLYTHLVFRRPMLQWSLGEDKLLQ